MYLSAKACCSLCVADGSAPERTSSISCRKLESSLAFTFNGRRRQPGLLCRNIRLVVVHYTYPLEELGDGGVEAVGRRHLGPHRRHHSDELLHARLLRSR